MLVHPGGPFWEGKDEGAWSVSKGLFEEKEQPLDAARREFREETGFEVEGSFIELGKIRQPSGKIVYVWAVEKDLDEKKVVSNNFSMEWPKGSRVIMDFPEIDSAGWFGPEDAKRMILKGQRGFIDRLVSALALCRSEK